MRAGDRASQPPRQHGFTLLAMLAALFILSIGCSKVLAIASHQDQRAREEDLIARGAEIRAAIGAYFEATPGPAKQFPKELDELLLDKRHLGLKRHLRNVSIDPITRGPWGLVRGADGTVHGVYSLSERAPIRAAHTAVEGLDSARSYSDWKFVYRPSSGTSSPLRS